jgi:hypothetical protein
MQAILCLSVAPLRYSRPTFCQRNAWPNGRFGGQYLTIQAAKPASPLNSWSDGCRKNEKCWVPKANQSGAASLRLHSNWTTVVTVVKVPCYRCIRPLHCDLPFFYIKMYLYYWVRKTYKDWIQIREYRIQKQLTRQKCTEALEKTKITRKSLAAVHSNHIGELHRRPSPVPRGPEITQIWRNPVARKLWIEPQ